MQERTRPGAAGQALLAALAAVAVAAGACGGDGERRFDAEGFVEEANRNGAGLELGGQLADVDSEDEIWALELRGGDDEAPERERAEEAEGEHEHAGASLRVTDDSSAATSEHQRCERAADLLCFRAANVVVVVDRGVPPVAIASLTAAISAMQAE